MHVAAGYDAIAERFARAAPLDHVAPWLEQMTDPLPPGARLLDLGCGAGAPARLLGDRFEVVGVDISREQLRVAAQNAPQAQLVLADIETVAFNEPLFDGVLSLYSLIHVRRLAHPRVISNIHNWLVPGGRCLMVLGANNTPVGYPENWFGAPMLWSHYDAETSLKLVEESGLIVERSAVVIDPIDDSGGSHLFVLCHRPETG